MPSVTFSFTIETSRDRVLLQALERWGSRSERSSKVREALYAYVGAGTATLDDVMAGLARVERKLDRVVPDESRQTEFAVEFDDEVVVDDGVLDAIDSIGIGG